jgi:hypothetical protein
MRCVLSQRCVLAVSFLVVRHSNISKKTQNCRLCPLPSRLLPGKKGGHSEEKTVELLLLRIAASSGCYCYRGNAVVALANTLEEALAITCFMSVYTMINKKRMWSRISAVNFRCCDITTVR